MRLRSIDFLRGVAVILVLFRHMYLPESDTIINKFLMYLHKIGWVGVDLFFVLSGFLVSGLIFKEYQKKKHFSAGRFLIRRGFKIYPAFYFLIGITVAYYLLRSREVPSLSLLAELFYFQNYVYGLWAHTWSLAVEEHFYIFLSIALFLYIGKNYENRISRLPYLIIVLVGLVTTGRVVNALFYSIEDREMFFTHYRMDSLLFGVLISYYYYYKKEAIDRWVTYRKLLLPLSVAIVLYTAPIKDSSIYMFTIGYSVLYLCFGYILICVIHSSALFEKKSILISAIVKIGFYSYSIYLWHLPIKFWGLNTVKLVLNPGYYMLLLIYLLLSCGIGIIMARLIEIPTLKLRDKYFPSFSK